MRATRIGRASTRAGCKSSTTMRGITGNTYLQQLLQKETKYLERRMIARPVPGEFGYILPISHTRVGEFDEPFTSTIHTSLQFP